MIFRRHTIRRLRYAAILPLRPPHVIIAMMMPLYADYRRRRLCLITPCLLPYAIVLLRAQTYYAQHADETR